GTLFVSLVVTIAQFLHCPEYTAMDWLQSVPHIRQGAPDDHGQRIVEIRASHLIFYVYMVAFRSCFHPIDLSSTIRPRKPLSSEEADREQTNMRKRPARCEAALGDTFDMADSSFFDGRGTGNALAPSTSNCSLQRGFWQTFG